MDGDSIHPSSSSERTMSAKTHDLQSVDSILHVYNRGVNREQIFFSDDGYEYFLSLIERHVVPQEIVLHGFTLMPNHFHLMLRQKVPYAVSNFMKRICDPYAKSVNRWLGRTGHLLSDRFKTRSVVRPEHLLQLSRYIHMNPVVARIVDSPSSWRFSSCGEFCGGRRWGFLDAGPVLSLVGGPEAYAAFLRDTKDGYNAENVKLFLDWREG